MQQAFFRSLFLATLFAAPATPQETIAFQTITGFGAGTSVALESSRLLVGAPSPSAPLTLRNGEVLVYERDGTGAWQELQALGSPNLTDESARFGTDLAASGFWLAVSAPDEGGVGAGAVHLYQHDGTDFVFTQTLVAPGSPITAPGFGESLSMDADTLVVGSVSYRDALGDQGRAFVYREAGGTWTLEAALQAGLTPASGGRFGRSVSIDADRLVVGDYAQSFLGNSEGAIFVFERSGTTWTETATIAGQNTLSYLGWQVALDGDTIVTAQPNTFALDASSFEVYEFDGTIWSPSATLDVSTGSLELENIEEFQIALDGDRLLLSDFSISTSDVRAFERIAGLWTETQIFSAFSVDGQAAGSYGASLALNGTEAVIGGYSAAPTGSAGVYTNNSGTWQFDQFVQPTAQLSLTAGFIEFFQLGHDNAQLGDFYVLLGSLSGTSPGFSLQGHLIPLNFDALTLNLIQAPNSTLFPNSFGTLQANVALPGIFLLPGAGDASLAGLELAFAAVFLDDQSPSTISGVTNALSVQIGL